MRTLIAALVISLGAAGVALADSKTTQVPDQVTGTPRLSPDGDLINKIHAINLTEKSMAEVAQKSSDSDRVKDFAQTMIKDHSDADDQLSKVAKTMNVPLVAPDSSRRTPDEIAQAKNMMDMEKQMKSEKGTTFDRDYLKMMVDGHKQALDMLTNATPTDPGLKQYVDSIVPVVQRHERMASALSNPGLGRRARP